MKGHTATDLSYFFYLEIQDVISGVLKNGKKRMSFHGKFFKLSKFWSDCIQL